MFLIFRPILIIFFCLLIPGMGCKENHSPKIRPTKIPVATRFPYFATLTSKKPLENIEVFLGNRSLGKSPIQISAESLASNIQSEWNLPTTISTNQFFLSLRSLPGIDPKIGPHEIYLDQHPEKTLRILHQGKLARVRVVGTLFWNGNKAIGEYNFEIEPVTDNP